ncbi:Serine/threonine protein phosphatase 7 long form isogeny [Arachis hypogaea]|uniref:Serine/threonine protein phosphatase 7 long form isogeny n=1 Tax=Arachis hypogaea TaxID=3818 RepID=A0A6B9V2D4_ARAHY|nr:Serine/threonine protein phosphatase 7 long form isogeny [Arachis hypogaea]
MAGVAHFARLNDRWFRLNKPLMSVFLEKWHPETHTFHLPFGECTITLQDIAYQLELSIDGQHISEYLTDFERYIDSSRPSWV